MAPSAQFAGGERRGGGTSTRSPPASGSSSGGGRPPLAPPHLCLRLAWLWTCLLLLAACPAATREMTPNLPLAMGEETGVPTRRLQQACQPWPLSFRNENCNGTAAVTVRAQLGAPLPPGSAPCLNGASQAGEWCVSTVELRPGQQQLVFPQVLDSTFQWYAEVKRASFGAEQLGGNLTSPETPWFDITSGQPCGPPPHSSTASIIACKPFRQANAAKEDAGCVDPVDLQPAAIQCGALNPICTTRLQIANNCSLNIGVRIYGVLATAMQPGYCVNNNTRPGEACLTTAYTYPAGTANTGGGYIFDGMSSAGLYIAAWVPNIDLSWPGNAPDPAGVFVDYITGERCPGPANERCLSFFQVPMDSSACFSSVTHTFVCPNATCTIPHCATHVEANGGCTCVTCENGYYPGIGCQTLPDQLQPLPGCTDVPFEVLNATFGDPSCASWATGAFVTAPCPTACNFVELPEECIDSVVWRMLVLSKGLVASNATLPDVVNAVLSGCAAGEPVGVEAVAAVAKEAFQPYTSCGPDAPAAVAASSCQLLNAAALAPLLTTQAPACDPECYDLLTSITLDCFSDYFVGLATQQGVVASKDAATVALALRMVLGGYMSTCEAQAAAPAPSSAPSSPPLPDQPGGNNTSSAGGSAPVAAIAGGLVGAVAAVAVCVLLVLALRRQRRRRQQLAGLAGKACDAFGPEGVDSSKGTSSHALSLASSGSAGIGAAVPPALASDPLVSWIMASQLSSKARKGSGTSALRSQGSGTSARRSQGSSSTQVRDWELDWADLKLQRAVGSGSYGKVYLAHWGTMPVAVKVLLVPGTAGANLATPGAAQEALALPPSALAELEAEAGLLASLRHPYCVNFFGLTRNPPALVIEYCSRGSVAELLDRARAEPAVAAELTWRRRLGMLLNAAEGMVYLHSHKRAPIVHRDFKSPNLLVDDSWRTKVTDFGLSRAMEDTALSSSVAVTNPRWLAPELMRGEHATQASDVFAFGVVMWELLTWERPWAAINPWQISSAVLGGRRLQVPNPAALPGPAADSPEAFAAYVQLMQQCWAQAPSDRPSFPAVVQALRTILGEEAPLGPANSA